MKVVVTGCAGFIGSHLTERLLADGHTVAGLDALTPYYDPRIKRDNLRAALAHPRFRFYRADLKAADLAPVLRGAATVYHLAGQPGVDSFGQRFAMFIDNNLTATHRLLEAAARARVRRLIFASSSSVYGIPRVRQRFDDAATPTRPVSPYGITKLAAEQLCLQYSHQGMVPAMAFRFFTVYGPRQRPDMAFAKLITAILRGRPFPVYGTGRQLRDFTYVGDVALFLARLIAPRDRFLPGTVLNLGGGHTISLNEAIRLVERAAGRKARIVRAPAGRGDMPYTRAGTARLRRLFGAIPRVRLEEGLAREVAWVRAHLRLLP